MSCPDNWGVTKGDAILVQQEEATRFNHFYPLLDFFLLAHVQERTDCRGPEDPDGKVENVNV